MTQRALLFALALLCTIPLLALAACRDHAPQPTPASATLSEAQLQGALFGVEDLPPGWERDGEDADVGEESEQADEETTFFLGQELPDRSRFTVTARYSGGDVGPFLTHAMTAFSGGQAAAAFAEQAEVIRAARPYTLTLSGGEKMAMEMWPLTFASLGSDSVAVRSVTDDAPLFGTVYTDSVYVLDAEADVIIRLTGISLSGEAMNREQMKALAQRSVEKLSTVLEQP